MGTTSGTPDPAVVTAVASDVADRLRNEPFCFEFFQAVRLLERLLPDREAVGKFANPSREVVRFGVNPTLSFPASEIQSLVESEHGPPTMTVNFMGLVGPVGTLPLYYTELVAGRILARDRTLRDFLDLFHHRIISLFYQAWQKYRFPACPERGEYERLAQYLLDLIGLGTAGLQDRQQVSDHSLIYYSGLLAQQPRSATALRLLLSDYFQAPVEIQQFVGAWYSLDKDAQCSLDEGADDSRQLGVGAVAGDEVWEPQARVRIVIGPLPLAQYLDFLPSGTAYEPLRAITRLFSGDEIDFEAQLILDRRETPSCMLGGEGATAPQLGLLSWAKTKPLDRDPADTILQLA
jgi:type VI secretion system protein ImpH